MLPFALNVQVWVASPQSPTLDGGSRAIDACSGRSAGVTGKLPFFPTTTNFYARSVTASGSTLTVGPLNKVSTAASNYSAAPCCTFGNDYGDYTGFDAAGGWPFRWRDG